MNAKKKIDSIVIKREIDQYPDTGLLGEYTDDLRNGVIVRQFKQFYEKLQREMERDENGRFTGKGDFLEPLPTRGREYRGFLPYASGEKQGSKKYYQYGMDNYNRMEALERGDWCFLHIQAIAKVLISLDNGKTWKYDEITSGGIGGIESDSHIDYINEIQQEDINDLKDYLLAYGFNDAEINAAVENLEIVEG